MVLFSLLLVLAADDAGDSLAKKMLPIYQKEISAYSLAVESAPKRKLELRKEPVLEWSNPVRPTQSQGVVFLWLREGRPAALGCIFSQRGSQPKTRRVIHELLALDREKLLVSRPEGSNQWKPRAGLKRKELADAAPPAATAGARVLQMRRLAREFTGYEEDRKEKRWDLRLLPAPLYRYPPAKTGILDGALFALVSTEGTDPEVLLILEVREEDGKRRWEYACGRFASRDLYVRRKDKEVWSSILNNDTNTFYHDPLHLYRNYHDKIVTQDGKVLANIRQTPRMPGGEVIPADKK
ncbi:MAG TPA: hypothetical protein VMG10_03910 [Gemmataceae bacterium]|nr:hypothetical protein [Gemmataceae bacterium]